MRTEQQIFCRYCGKPRDILVACDCKVKRGTWKSHRKQSPLVLIRKSKEKPRLSRGGDKKIKPGDRK